MKIQPIYMRDPRRSTLSILLDTRGVGLAIEELATALEVSTGTAHLYVFDLINRGLVTRYQDESGRTRYRVKPHSSDR